MAATQADVARLAGVSQRTVSNVVNKFPYVSAETSERVHQAIAQLNYAPSHAARSLRSGRSRMLQLVIPELDVPYFAELGRDILKYAEDRGFGVMIRQTLGSQRREQDALEGSIADYAEGTILSAVQSIEHLVQLSRDHTPVVLIGELSGMNVVDHIGIDDVAAAAQATAHLVTRGCRRIAFIGADPNASLRMAELRLRGYQQALAAAGLAIDESLVFRATSYHRRDGEEAMSTLLELEPRPDGVFCATDLLALGALKAARHAGVRVPEDVAIMGFDGLEEGEYSVPSLSTIAPDKEELARVAVDTLLARIDALSSAGVELPARDILIPFTLVVRGSTS